MTFEGTEQLLARRRDFMTEHRTTYLSTGGRQGHILDMTDVGARGMLPTLLLKTIGRRSGKSLVTPLIYGCFGGEWVVVASKGGAPEHPAWFLNLQAEPEVFFQVATQCFRAGWRLPEGDERAAVWTYMAHLFPPYNQYQQATAGRVIPLVMLNPAAEVPVFEYTPA